MIQADIRTTLIHLSADWFVNTASRMRCLQPLDQMLFSICLHSLHPFTRHTPDPEARRKQKKSGDSKKSYLYTQPMRTPTPYNNLLGSYRQFHTRSLHMKSTHEVYTKDIHTGLHTVCIHYSTRVWIQPGLPKLNRSAPAGPPVKQQTQRCRGCVHTRRRTHPRNRHRPAGM